MYLQLVSFQHHLAISWNCTVQTFLQDMCKYQYVICSHFSKPAYTRQYVHMGFWLLEDKLSIEVSLEVCCSRGFLVVFSLKDLTNVHVWALGKQNPVLYFPNHQARTWFRTLPGTLNGTSDVQCNKFSTHVSILCKMLIIERNLFQLICLLHFKSLFKFPYLGHRSSGIK